MRTIILIALLFVVAWFTKPKTIVSPHVKQYIQEFSENLAYESFACLEYIEVDGTLVVYDYEIPNNYYATSNAVYADACAPSQMPVHNHPSKEFSDALKQYYKVATGNRLVNINQMLYLSYQDMKISYRDGYDHVSVASHGQWAWWTRNQFKKELFKGKLITLSKRNQKLWLIE